MPTHPNTSSATADRIAPAWRDVSIAALIVAVLAGGVFADGVLRAVLLFVGLCLGALAPYPGLLAIALTVWMLPLMQMPAVVSDIRADELLLAFVAAGAAVRMLRQRDWKPGVVERAFVVFVLLTVISLGIKYVFGYEMPFRAVAVPVMRHVARLLLFVATAYLLEGRSARFMALAVTMTVGAVLAATLGIVQYHSVSLNDWVVRMFPTLDGVSTYPYVPGGPGYRSMSTFDGNPNRFGLAMTVMALFAAAVGSRSASLRPRVAWGLAAVVMITAILFTTSRTAFLVAVLMFVVAALLLRSRLPVIVLGVWMAVMAVVPNLMPQRVLDLFGTRTPTGVVVPDPSVSGRISAMASTSVEVAQKLPTYDNYYLDVFHNFGPVALIGFVWLVWIVGSRLLRIARRSADERGYGAAAFLVWGALALVSFTGAFFSAPRVTEVVWIIIAMAFAWQQAAASGPPDDSAGQPVGPVSVGPLTAGVASAGAPAEGESSLT